MKLDVFIIINLNSILKCVTKIKHFLCLLLNTLITTIQVEALQSELSEAKDKIEGLTIDLEIMKAEFEKIGSSGESLESDSVTSYQMKQLEQQNIRLRETLVR